MQHDTSAFLSLLLERINAVAPNLDINFGECLEHVDSDVSVSSEGSIVNIGIRALARFSISKDLSKATIQLSSKYKTSQKILVAVHSFLSTLVHAIRGDLTFHGNSLSYGGKSYAVFGGSVAGKSTITLFALLSGHRLIGDDSVIIQENQKVTGGRPFLHLTKDTAHALLDNQEFSARKEYRLLADLRLQPALREAEPLSRIYMLEEGGRIDIQSCTDLPQTLFKMLNSSQFMALLVKYNPAIVDSLLALLQVTKVKKLIYPRSYDSLSETLLALERDLMI